LGGVGDYGPFTTNHWPLVSPSPLDMSYLQLRDIKLYYEQYSRGPNLVLLHGFSLNSLMWEPHREFFEDRFRLTLIDLRGFGKSGVGDRWSHEVMAEDVWRLLNHLEIEKTALLGFSMSGPTAMRLAIDQPDLVTALILVSSILPLAEKRSSERQKNETALEIAILERQGIEAWAKNTGIFDGFVVGSLFERNPEIKPLWERIINRNEAENLAKVLKLKMENEPLNWRSQLGEIKTPTLIIAGTNDISFVDASRNLSRRIPNSKLMIIRDSGHMLTLEDPKGFANILIDFFNEVGQVVPT
jgi:pimeloyl-ACP methyl ester carboxylesterase